MSASTHPSIATDSHQRLAISPLRPRRLNEVLSKRDFDPFSAASDALYCRSSLRASAVEDVRSATALTRPSAPCSVARMAARSARLLGRQRCPHPPAQGSPPRRAQLRRRRARRARPKTGSSNTSSGGSHSPPPDFVQSKLRGMAACGQGHGS